MNHPTHYRSQSGRVTAIHDLHADHLARAVAKLERSRAKPTMLVALKAEQKRRAEAK